jgi:hypothetical protein
LNTTSIVDSIEENVDNFTDSMFGDVVEYNIISQIETVLEVAYHRFNTINRESNNFLEGYYYKPHYKHQIKKFSDYVQIRYNQTDDIPYYATVVGDGRTTWRDILPNNFSNGNVIPFLNGCHYIYQGINLFVQRQDPCDDYTVPNKTIIAGLCDTNQKFVEVPPANNFCE